MASGCAVLTTKNKGVVEYAEDGKNCIIFHMNNPDNMAEKIISVIENDILRKKVIFQGLKTASKYTWDKIIPQIIEYYRQIAGYTPMKNRSI